jgi:hypothetical protein
MSDQPDLLRSDGVIDELRGRVGRLEQHYNLKIADSALIFAVGFRGRYPWPGCLDEYDLIDSTASMARLDHVTGRKHWKLRILDEIEFNELYLKSICRDIEGKPTAKLQEQKNGIEATLAMLRRDYERDTATDVALAEQQMENLNESAGSPSHDHAMQTLHIAKLRYVMECSFRDSGELIDAHVAVFLAREATRLSGLPRDPRQPAILDVLNLVRRMKIID